MKYIYSNDLEQFFKGQEALQDAFEQNVHFYSSVDQLYLCDINGSFTWDQVPEGFEFWSRIHDEFETFQRLRNSQTITGALKNN